VHDAPAAPTTTRTAWWSCAVIIALCLGVGLQTIRSDNYFLGDDFGLIHHLHDLPFDRFLTYFVSDWTEGIYGTVLDELRPFLAFSYWVDARLFGSVNVGGYHATNVILHVLNALLVLAIARSVAPREPMFAVMAGSFFALMPSHAEPIAWISGRVDSIASLFYLGAFLCFVRFRLAQRGGWLFAAWLLFVGGLFAKQSVVTLPVLLVAFDLLWPVSIEPARTRAFARLWPHIAFVVAAASYVALRHTLFGNALREDMVTLAAINEFIGRQDRYVREMLPSPNTAPRLVRTLAEAVTILAVLVCAGWALARRQVFRHRIRRVAFFGVAWYAITIAPMVVTYISARHLYITAAGVSIAIASLVLPAPDEDRRRRRMRAVVAGMLIALYAVASIWNVSNWVASGQESHRFASALARLPQSVPRGSVVLVSVPEFYREGWFWSWAMPFAGQPPFTDADLSQAFRIVERPPTYCCPPDQWWASRKTSVTTLLDATVAAPVVYVEFVPNGSPRIYQRGVNAPLLKQQLEAALGKPVDSITTMTPEDAAVLSRVLFAPQ
jgi:hypothetical protein